MIITDLHARLAKLAVTAMKLDRKERELRERATAGIRRIERRYSKAALEGITARLQR